MIILKKRSDERSGWRSRVRIDEFRSQQSGFNKRYGEGSSIIEHLKSDLSLSAHKKNVLDLLNMRAMCESEIRP